MDLQLIAIGNHNRNIISHTILFLHRIVHKIDIFTKIENRLLLLFRPIIPHSSFEQFQRESDSNYLIRDKEDTKKGYHIHWIGKITEEFNRDGYTQSKFFKTFDCKQKSETKKRLRSDRCYSLYESWKNLI